MRYLLFLLCAYTSFGWAMLEIPFSSSDWPKGNYQKDCKDCRIDDGRLSCSCEAPDNKFYNRSLDLSLCTLDTVSVRRGVLFCETDLSLVPEPEEVIEEDTSEPIEPIEGLPKGDYLRYCSECRVEDGVLDCRCKIGGWVWDSYYKVSLPLASCEEPDRVLYAGGLLFCSLHELLEFHGLTNRCNDCRLANGKLICRCQKTRCGWSSTDIKKGRNITRSSLPSMQNCTSAINNCNGKLRCGECWSWDYSDETVLSRPVEGRNPKHGYCYPDSIW
ncbi:hypothetical protein [Endozoicomonas arenosclerae]|uniref:hypothetical protein n=1 Tax=Endozoicomonas arenosclerae TaxID=1633495 RepID=UPI0007858177|nr:hypothetical protein [Endozoicomonas arenosclerae]